MRRNLLFLILAIMMMAMFTNLVGQTTVTLGTQVVQSGTSGIGPTNYYWEARRIQWVYTAAEILAGGGSAGSITSLAFDVSQVAGGNLVNYKVKMAHTTATNASTHNTATLTTVKNAHTFVPGSTGWRTIEFDSAFEWDGTNNILFDISWGVNSSYGSNGQVWLYNNVTNQMRGATSSSASVENSSTTTTRSGKPRAQLSITESEASKPNPAENPNPTHEATFVSNTPTLSWTSGGGLPTSYDVYFGSSIPPAYIGNQAGTTYSPGTLDYESDYYWTIIPVNDEGEADDCPLWSFTTGPDPTITEFPYTESFDDASYPPWGWTHVIGSGATGWQSSTGSSNPTVSPYRGDRMLFYNAFNLTANSNATLISPPLDASRSELMYNVSFWMYRELGGTYSAHADRVEVYSNSSPSATGATLVGTVHRSAGLTPLESASGWYEYTFEIGMGGDRDTKYVLLKAVSAYGNNVNIDEVSFFGLEMSDPPNIAILTSPANTATNVAITTNLVWASGGGAPTGYKVYMGTNPDEMNEVSDQADTIYDPEENLLFASTYHWKVDPYNEKGFASEKETLPVWTFSTPTGIATTPTPSNNATNYDATNRVLGWTAVTGASGYKVKAGTSTGASDLVDMAVVGTNSYTHTANWPYSSDVFWTIYTLNGSQEIQGTEWKFSTGTDPTLYPPFLQDFSSVTFPPLNWTRFSGELTETSTLTTTTSGFSRKAYGNTGTNFAAAMNIYTTGKYWLVTPPIDLGSSKAGYSLELDAKLTNWNSTVTGTMDADDFAAIVISTDGTWSSNNILKFWNQANPLTEEHVVIDLSGYSGLVKIGLYGASSAGGTDLDLFYDNISVSSADAPPSAPTNPTPANLATNVAINTNLSWTASSGNPNGYKVYLSTDGETFDNVSDQSGTVYDPDNNFSFATPYSWYVIAYNDGGETQSATWTFTTTNGKATTPVPANNTLNYVSTLRTLRWNAVAGASGYKIKIGTTTGGNEVADMIVCETNSYTHPSNWQYSMQYFWTVYTMNGEQQINGDEWNFTTGADPNISSFPWIETVEVSSPSFGNWLISGGTYNWGYSSAVGGYSQSSRSFIANFYNIPAPTVFSLFSPPLNMNNEVVYNLSFDYAYATYTDGEVDALEIYTSIDEGQSYQLAEAMLGGPSGPLNTAGSTGSNFVPTAGQWATKTIVLPQGTNALRFTAISAYGNNLYLDNVRVLLPDTQVNQGVATGGNANIDLPEITVGAQTFDTSVSVEGVADGAVVNVAVGYSTPNVSFPNAGLNFTFSGSTFAGATITINHNLGFVPAQLAYKVAPSVNWILVSTQPTWTINTAVIQVPNAKADGDVIIVFPKEEGQTLPVSLSSFTAVLTAEMFVNIAWVSESETNHLGYNLLRNTEKDLENAALMNISLIGNDDGESIGSQTRYLYTDREIIDNNIYYYWLESVAINGELQYAGPIMVTVGNPGSEPPTPVIPVETALMSAYPNPFNPQTNMRYSLKEAGDVRLEVYNIKGQLIRSFEKTHNVPGYFSIVWDGKDAKGQMVGSGVYFYRMTSGKYSATRKMMLMK